MDIAYLGLPKPIDGIQCLYCGAASKRSSCRSVFHKFFDPEDVPLPESFVLEGVPDILVETSIQGRLLDLLAEALEPT
jgi:hypothetical protein